MMEMDSEEIPMLLWLYHGMLFQMLELFQLLEGQVHIHLVSQMSIQMSELSE